jgi:hypothetical protein
MMNVGQSLAILELDASEANLKIFHRTIGGKRVYRFFKEDAPSDSYFNTHGLLGETVGMKAAYTWLDGYRTALYYL